MSDTTNTRFGSDTILDRAPTSTDNITLGYDVGDRIIYNANVYMCVNSTENDAKWVRLTNNDVAIKTAVESILDPILYIQLQTTLATSIGIGNITFSRSSNATYVDLYGTLQYVSVDIPRFEKDGLLIEGESTNLFSYSNNFTNAVWDSTLTSRTSVEVNSSDILSIDGTNNSTKITMNNTGKQFLKRSYTFTENKKYTASIFIYIPTQENINKYRFLTDYDGNDEIATDYYTDFDKWIRVSTTTLLTAQRNTINFKIDVNDTNDIPPDGFYFYIFGAQVEQLEFMSSYIPTTDTSIMRAADVCYMDCNGNMVAGSQPSSTVFTFDLIGIKEDPTKYSTLLTTNINSYSYKVNNDSEIMYNEGFAGETFQAIELNTKYRIGVTNDLTTQKIYINGVLKDTLTFNSVKSCGDKLSIGNEDGNTDNTMYGHISLIKIYNKALTDLDMVMSYQMDTGTNGELSDAEILAKIKNVDGSGSGLDADTLDGYDATSTPTEDAIPIADSNGKLNDWISQGSGSGLDADTLDGKSSDEFADVDLSNVTNDKIVNKLNHSLPSGTDLNTITTSGFYRLSNNNINSPSGSDWGELFVIHGGGDTIAQILFGYTKNNRQWVRYGNPSDVGGSGSWIEWQTIITSGMVGLQSITGNGSINIDWNNGSKVKLTLTANTTVTFTNPSNPINLFLEIVQDATGGHTLTLPTIKWSGGSSPTLSTSANNISTIALFWDGSNYLGMSNDEFA